MFLLAGCATLLEPSAEWQASLQQLIGRVLVIREDVYVTGWTGMVLQPGDRIVTMEQAVAEIDYRGSDRSDEPVICTLELPESQQLTVGGLGDCRTGGDRVGLSTGSIIELTPRPSGP